MNIDYKTEDWKEQKRNLDHLDEEDIYNYSIATINYAKTHNERDWFNFSNESTNYTNILKKKNKAEILSKIHNLYEKAKNGICTMSSHYRVEINNLAKKGKITIIKDLEYAISFMPII